VVPAAAPVELAAELGVYLRVKRFIDVLGSLAMMVLLAPIFLIATVLVLFDVGPPVLFWQERTGWRGRPFLIYNTGRWRAPLMTRVTLRSAIDSPRYWSIFAGYAH